MLKSFQLYEDRQTFAIQFLEKLREYYQSNGKNGDIYGWLIHRSNKMQSEMGGQGIIRNYRPPAQNYMLNNYPIILNMLPNLHREFQIGLFLGNLPQQYMDSLQESIVRYLGRLDDEKDELRKELKNPIKWFREGVRGVMALPIYLFVWLGFITDNTARRLTLSFLFSVISGLVTLVGFVSGVVSLVVGWDAFIDIVSNLLPYKNS
jgi:hypothetical protein